MIAGNKTPIPWLMSQLHQPKYRSLSRAEEHALFERMAAGDETAQELLVNASLKFVVGVAKNYLGKGLEMEELVAEGTMGLIKAVKRFDRTSKFKLISYAVWWIRQSILQALAEQGRTIRLHAGKLNDFGQISKAIIHLEQRLGRRPGPGEIAEAAGVRDAKIDEYYQFCGGPELSLNMEFEGEEGKAVEGPSIVDPAPGPDKTTTDADLTAELNRMLSHLNPKEIEVIRRHYGLGIGNPSTLKDVGERMGITRERARQIRNEALKKIKKHLRSDAARIAAAKLIPSRTSRTLSIGQSSH